MRTLKEETVEGDKKYGGGSITQRWINGKQCLLWYSSTNKEEAIANFKALKDQYKSDDFSRKYQFAKMTIMQYGWSKGKVYLVWSCWK